MVNHPNTKVHFVEKLVYNCLLKSQFQPLQGKYHILTKDPKMIKCQLKKIFEDKKLTFSKSLGEFGVIINVETVRDYLKIRQLVLQWFLNLPTKLDAIKFHTFKILCFSFQFKYTFRTTIKGIWPTANYISVSFFQSWKSSKMKEVDRNTHILARNGDQEQLRSVKTSSSYASINLSMLFSYPLVVKFPCQLKNYS